MNLPEISDGELPLLEALFELQEGEPESAMWKCAQVEERAGGRRIKNVNTILFNLERKGFVRHEKRPVPGKKRMYHWQITIAGCAALMRARAEG